MTGTPTDKARRIIDHYGAAHQKIKLCEECGELIQALCKSPDDSPDVTADIVEEMADVMVLIMQFRESMAPYWYGVFERTIDQKIDRQLERIANGE